MRRLEQISNCVFHCDYHFYDYHFLSFSLPPRWPSGKASASRAEDPGFESRWSRDFFLGRVIPVTSKLALQWLPCLAPGVTGSALGLVGTGVSILRLRTFDLQLLSQCGSTSNCLSRSVPRRDVKQPTNKQSQVWKNPSSGKIPMIDRE